MMIADTEMIRFALDCTFGREWQALSAADQALIIRDCVEDGPLQDFQEYRRSIGSGNLASYARVMAARFGKGQ